MARNESGQFSLPSGSTVTAGEDVLASQHNTPLLDIAADLNVARPIVAGGTGADTAPGARAALAVGASVATVADIATTKVYPQRVVMVRGRDADGDGGLARYEYQTSEPSHAEKAQDATGAWYALAERDVCIEMFGGAADGSAYVDSEFDKLVAYCVATGATWRHRGTIKLANDHTIADTFHAVGFGGRSRSDTDGNRDRSTIGLNSDAQILIQDASGEDGTISECRWEDLYFFDLETGTAPTNRQTYYEKPMLESGRAYGWLVNRCTFDGKGYRRYGVWLGKGNTIWGSTITQCHAQGCGLGIVIGHTNDSTNNHVTACTAGGNIHGIVVYNPRGGSLRDNNPENNEGCGIAVITTSGTSDYTISNNYMYRNGVGTGIGSETLGDISVLGNGEELPWTDWTTPGTNEVASSFVPYGVTIERNYIISEAATGSMYSILSGAQRGTVITGNRVESDDTVDAADLLLTAGAGADTIIAGNWSQGSTSQNATTHTNGWRTPLLLNVGDGSIEGTIASMQLEADGILNFGEGVAQTGSLSPAGLYLGLTDASTQKSAVIKPIHVLHIGGATTDLVDLATDLPSGSIGKFKLELVVTQSASERNHQLVELKFHTDLNDLSGSVDVSAAIYDSELIPPSRDSRTYSLASGKIQMTGTNDAYVSGVLIAIASTY